MQRPVAASISDTKSGLLTPVMMAIERQGRSIAINVFK
jgi:hypothetical protein